MKRHPLICISTGAATLLDDGDLNRSGFVYFIRECRSGGLIKIGFSRDVTQRLESLRALRLLPLELIGYRPGTVALEQLLHAHFEEFRMDGEWFRPARRVVRMANRLGRWSRDNEASQPRHGVSFDEWLKEEDERAPGFLDSVDSAAMAIYVAGKLKQLRIRSGVSQEQMARMMKTSQPSLARAESGTIVPSPGFVAKMASVLGYESVFSFRPEKRSARGKKP